MVIKEGVYKHESDENMEELLRVSGERSYKNMSDLNQVKMKIKRSFL